MKRLIKPLLILAVFQIGMTVLLRILKGRFLSQEISEGEINAVGVRGGEPKRRSRQQISEADTSGL